MVKLADADDIDHMASWKQTLYKFSPLMSVCSLAAYWVYFIYRVKYTVDAQRVAHKTFYMAWAFIVVELGVACKFSFSFARLRLIRLRSLSRLVSS